MPNPTRSEAALTRIANSLERIAEQLARIADAEEEKVSRQ